MVQSRVIVPARTELESQLASCCLITTISTIIMRRDRKGTPFVRWGSDKRFSIFSKIEAGSCSFSVIQIGAHCAGADELRVAPRQLPEALDSSALCHLQKGNAF